MPYNNTPIAPSNEVTGTVSLPLARVKKIISTDPDIASCSNNASFVITVAAEMFLQHLVEQAHNIVKTTDRTNDRVRAGKPRRNIQYRDVAAAVSRREELEFLADVVPKTQVWRSVKQKKKDAQVVVEGQENGDPAVEGAGMNGQRTLDRHLGVAGAITQTVTYEEEEQQVTNGAVRSEPVVEVMDVDDTEDEEELSIHAGVESGTAPDRSDEVGPAELNQRMEVS